MAPVLAGADPAVVVASDLARARDTGQAVADAAGVPLVVDPRLRELFLGAWQGLTSEQACERYPDQHAAWRAGTDVPRGGGETYAEAGARAAACLAELLGSVPVGGTLVAVTHGGTARAAVATLLELSREDAWRVAPLGNTCWSVLVEADRGWRLERHNAGLGPLVGPASGATDLGSPPSPDAEPVR